MLLEVFCPVTNWDHRLWLMVRIGCIQNYWNFHHWHAAAAVSCSPVRRWPDPLDGCSDDLASSCQHADRVYKRDTVFVNPLRQTRKTDGWRLDQRGLARKNKSKSGVLGTMQCVLLFAAKRIEPQQRQQFSLQHTTSKLIFSRSVFCRWWWAER